MNKKTYLIIGIFALSMFAMQTNTTQAKQNELPAVVKIGFLYPATGDLAAIGDGLLYGAKAAAYRVNMTDTYDFDVVLDVQDTATNPDTAKTAAQALISGGIEVIVGAAASSSTVSVSTVTIPAEVPIISYSSTSPAITSLEDNGYVFRDVASDAYQGQALAQLAFDKGVTKAYLLNRDDAYGNGVAAEFEKKFISLGGTIAEKKAYNTEAANYDSEVSAVKASSADGVILVAFPDDANKILAKANDEAVNLKFFGTDGIASKSVTNNTATVDYVSDNLFGTQPSTGTSPGETSKYTQFTSDIAAVGGAYDAFADYSYDAVLLAAAAIKDAGSYDGKLIRDSLYKIANGFVGATGTNKAFNCAGEPVSQAYDYWKALNGAIVVTDARVKDFTGLGDVATAPCSTASPGYEFVALFTGLFAIVVINKNKKRNN